MAERKFKVGDRVLFTHDEYGSVAATVIEVEVGGSIYPYTIETDTYLQPGFDDELKWPVLESELSPLEGVTECDSEEEFVSEFWEDWEKALDEALNEPEDHLARIADALEEIAAMMRLREVPERFIVNGAPFGDAEENATTPW